MFSPKQTFIGIMYEAWGTHMDHLEILSEVPRNREHSYDKILHQVAIPTDRKSVTDRDTAAPAAGDAVLPCQHTAKCCCHTGICQAGEPSWAGIGPKFVSGVQTHQPTPGVEYELGPPP